MANDSPRRWYPGICYLYPDGYTRDEALRSVGPGWAELVGRAWDAVARVRGTVTQVKEKLGGLRVYYTIPRDSPHAGSAPEVPGGEEPHELLTPVRLDLWGDNGVRSVAIGGRPDPVRNELAAVERASFITCERCGRAGVLRTAENAPAPSTGKRPRWVWLKTLCDSCAVAYYVGNDRRWDAGGPQ